MRRIKSSPANLSLMKHRNKKLNKITNSISIFTVFGNDNTENYIENYTKNDIEKIERKKNKNIISTTSNIISDYLFDNTDLPYEENYFISFLISYVSENIINKDKLKNLQAFIIQNSIRFIVSYLFHKHIISDIIENINLHLH
tara:strand:+ start:1306 stop:1734 length:429 start_codon:yes stop_codon:yes gene_type:complete